MLLCLHHCFLWKHTLMYKSGLLQSWHNILRWEKYGTFQNTFHPKIKYCSIIVYIVWTLFIILIIQFISLCLWTITQSIHTYKLIFCNIYRHSWWQLERDTTIRVQILKEVICISNKANILGKDMHPTIFLSSMV